MSALEELIQMADRYSKEFTEMIPKVEKFKDEQMSKLTPEHRAKYADELNRSNTLYQDALKGNVKPSDVEKFAQSLSDAGTNT